MRRKWVGSDVARGGEVAVEVTGGVEVVKDSKPKKVIGFKV